MEFRNRISLESKNFQQKIYCDRKERKKDSQNKATRQNLKKFDHADMKGTSILHAWKETSSSLGKNVDKFKNKLSSSIDNKLV